MRRLLGISVCLMCVMMAGCATIKHTEEDKAAFSVGATPLDLKSINAGWKKEKTELNGIQSSFDKRDYLGYVATRSEFLCGKFLTGLVVAANGTNTTLDMATTVFSALGTALTPLSAVHAMTAGSSITSGWKTAIDSDIYSKMAVQNIVQAIQSTYYKDMASYVNQLETSKEDDLTVTAELAKLQTIHGECTLGSAEGSITASLNPGGSKTPAASTTATSIAVATSSAGGASAAETLSLTGSSSAITGIPQVSVAVHANDTAAQIRDAIHAAVVATISPVKPEITASVSGNAVILQSPAAEGITWDVKPSNAAGVTVTVQALTPGTKAGQPGEAAQ